MYETGESTVAQLHESCMMMMMIMIMMMMMIAMETSNLLRFRFLEFAAKPVDVSS